MTHPSTRTHPLIRLHVGAAGHRLPLLAGTRLYVHQVVATLRGSDGDTDETAGYLGIRPQQVRAALAYDTDFPDEVDSDAEAVHRFEREQRAQWEHQQQALA